MRQAEFGRLKSTDCVFEGDSTPKEVGPFRGSMEHDLGPELCPCWKNQGLPHTLSMPAINLRAYGVSVEALDKSAQECVDRDKTTPSGGCLKKAKQVLHVRMRDWIMF